MDKPFTSFQYSDKMTSGGNKMRENEIKCPECGSSVRRGHEYETICPKCGLVVAVNFAPPSKEKRVYPGEEYPDIREMPIKHKGGNAIRRS